MLAASQISIGMVVHFIIGIDLIGIVYAYKTDFQPKLLL